VVASRCLEARDLEQERVDAEVEQRRLEQERYRKETPLVSQLREAVAKSHVDRCREVVAELVSAGPPHLRAGLDVLFASNDPALIASSLQAALRKLELTKDEWATVARGGEALGNNAIRSIAESKAR
jgi:hypothetical protein